MLNTSKPARLALAICTDLIGLAELAEKGELSVANRDLTLMHIEARAELILEWAAEVRGRLREAANG